MGDSSTTAPTTGWSTDSPEWEQGKYIWQRTVTTMADGSKTTSDPVCIQGAAGTDGTSVSVTSNTVTYATSTSGTVPPESWSETIPDLQPGEYLWSRTVTEYSDGTESVSYGVSYQGENGTNGTDGANGTDGNGIVSSTVVYQIGTSGTTLSFGRGRSLLIRTETSRQATA